MSPQPTSWAVSLVTTQRLGRGLLSTSIGLAAVNKMGYSVEVQLVGCRRKPVAHNTEERLNQTPPESARRAFAKAHCTFPKTHIFLKDIKARNFLPHSILDVGANAGHWTRMAMEVFPSAHFLLIEPQREMEADLEKLVSETSLIEFVMAGAASRSGEMVQTIWSDLQGSSFIPAPSEDLLQSGKQRCTKMVTIDEVLDERPNFAIPSLVKLDVQGFELEALGGANSLFGKTEVFILETSLFRFFPALPLTRECVAFMAEHGYEIYDIVEHLRRPYDGALGQVDLAFAKRDGVLRNSNAWA